MDLEKKMTEFRQVEEVLKQKLVSSEQEVYCMGDETEDVRERLFVADNMAVVSVGISKELLGQLQTLQLSLKSSATRLRSKLESSNAKFNDFLVRLLDKELKESEFLLLNAKYSADGSQEELNALCCIINETLQLILKSSATRLKSKLKGSKEELKAKENSLSKLERSNAKFNDLLVRLLDKELKESEFLLLIAKYSADGSQEELNAICCIINEMENVIADSEVRICKAKSRAENAETKCPIWRLMKSWAFLRVVLMPLTRLISLRGS
ncbi:uncharacterized protein LOC133825095 [Humulus lupulus]|uniref:uncharacterized protein LOC133825095 n=1 Tax=Humulus lupulus TaxID=3486 RepID=UPI002B40F3F2|nr:uncharacterized protein LOC133825095 [Humulus lupulus]